MRGWAGAVAVVTALGCGRADPGCPAGLAPDAARTQALIARLAAVDEGAAVTRRLTGAPRVCFGQVAVSAVSHEGVVLLDSAMPDAEAAARLGHLLLHVLDGSPAPSAGEADCDAAVRRALDIEARAFAMELRLRQALGVTGLRYGFEEDLRRAPIEAREATIRAWLEAHPAGGQGVDALAEGYRRRCEGR